MGRPKLGVKLTTVRLSEAVMARIDALCGNNQRGKFIREAVEEALDRREREASAKPERRERKKGPTGE